MKLTVFVLLMASPDWLALPRADRGRLADEAAKATFTDTRTSFRFFDAEAFSARVSDVLMITAERAEDHYSAIERLRDTTLITDRYFTVVEIIPAYENGHREFEGRH